MPVEAITQYRHGRVPRAVREQQLLALAEELFAEVGYTRASMDELARRAGVTKPVVYGIFESKDGLFRACMAKAAEDLAESVATAVRAARDPEAKVRAGALAFFRWAAEQRRSWDVLMSGGADGRFAAELQAIRERQAKLVAVLLADAAQSLGAKPVSQERLTAAAHAINGASEGLVTWAQTRPDVTPEQLADGLVDLVLPGLRAIGGI